MLGAKSLTFCFHCLSVCVFYSLAVESAGPSVPQCNADDGPFHLEHSETQFRVSLQKNKKTKEDLEKRKKKGEGKWMKIHLSVQQLQGFIHVSEGGLELCAQTQGSDGGMMMRDLAFF